MTDQVDIPKVGPVNKKVLIGVGVALAGFLAWRYYLAGSGAAPADEGAAAEDAGYEDGGTIPAVEGATDWYGSGSSSSGDTTSSTSQALTTNAAWSQYASNQLVALDVASGSDIATALGNYLAGRPLTSAQQAIVQAAIAYAGYPPVGTHVVVPGGDTDITVAPTGLKVIGQSPNSVTLSWVAVAGASFYDVYRSGAASNAVRSGATSATISGLNPNTSYTFQVAAVSGSGKAGPRSSSVSGKTAAVSLARPSTPSVTAITATGAKVSTGRVAGATGYRWYVNGKLNGATDGPAHSISGLKKSTKYTVSVKADNSTQAPGPESAKRSFTTRSK